MIRVTNVAFLKPDFKILAFFEHLWLFLEIKKARQNLAFSGFLQSERLGSGKTLSELHIHYKSLLKRVYNHAGCTKYWKYFTVALKMIDGIDKKQTYHNVITGKENASKEWNCITSMFLTGFDVHFLFGYVYFLCICLETAIWLLQPFWGGKVWLFLMKTGWQPWPWFVSCRKVTCLS